MTAEPTNITLTFPHKQPTADELLAMLARVMGVSTPPVTRYAFTALELAHARVEMRPTAMWNENGQLEVRVEA